MREIIRHALIWVWKDEEMHTISIRGAILRLGGWRLRRQALATQLAGGLGGWASSVLQHSRWRRAPVSRSLATLVTFLGRLVGKVPADVRRHLQYGPFRGFCAFNVDAEKTAAVCWQRIAELAASQPDIAHDLATSGGESFQRRFLDRVLAEDWWRRHCGDARVLATRIPAEWAASYSLHGEAMNPVMTAAFMRAGRLPHRSPRIPRLYLAGSATHPGQWVSFCVISGVLAADRVLEDLGA